MKELTEIRPNSDEGFQDLIAYLREKQTLRRFCIKSQMRANNSLEHLLARAMGYHTGLPEEERKKLMSQSKKLREQVEISIRDGADPPSNHALSAGIFGMIFVSYASRQHWDQQRLRTEDDMVAAAHLLPVWPWVKSVAGVSELGLAVLVGEAGDIGNYSGPGKLWKRLGLACFDGTRQGFVPAEITGDERKASWIARGYNPQRRAETYAFLDDVMFRHQWRGDRDENGKSPLISKKPVATPAHATGPYGQVYGDRKAWNIARGLNPMHADREAKRIMSKRFIRDLWNAWQDARIERLTEVQAAQ